VPTPQSWGFFGLHAVWGEQHPMNAYQSVRPVSVSHTNKYSNYVSQTITLCMKLMDAAAKHLVAIMKMIKFKERKRQCGARCKVKAETPDARGSCLKSH
jgi:hypothetical protein